MDIPEHDVIVVGAGNAATCAALSATENGASVLQLEISPEASRGGNSAFTGGAFRVVYHGFDDLAQLIPDINDNELQNVDVGTYTAEQYFDDIGRLTEYRCDPDLSEILITRSFDTARWMREKGVRFQLGLGRQAFRVDGKFKFWGGLACHIWGGGKELIKALASRADREQIRVRTTPRLSRSCRAMTGSAACGYGIRGASSICARAPSCSPAAGSRPMPRCAPAISGRAGIWRRCAAAASTPGRGSAWRSISARRQTGIGPARMPAPGTSTRRLLAISMSATAFRSTAIRLGLSSTRGGSAFSTRAPISTATPMRNTAARS